MLNEMRLVYEAELERHLSTLSAADAALITAALHKVTGSTRDAEARAEQAAAW